MRFLELPKRNNFKRFLTECEKLCPEELSFNVLLHTVPFYRAYSAGRKPKSLMEFIKELADKEMASDERLSLVCKYIEK